jgi:hypothetical protein
VLEIQVDPYCCPFRVWTPEQGRVLTRLFAYDTETTAIVEGRPDQIPSLVLASAYDGNQGLFVGRQDIKAFFDAHATLGFIGHNLAFDLKVTQRALGHGYDLYALVEAGKLWDTQVLKRLYSLATAGHTARGGSSLDDCARDHLGVELPKDLRDDQGSEVRTGFGRFLGRPLSEIPEVYLRYAGGDPLITWHLFQELNRLIQGVLRGASGVWGYAGEQWLKDAIRQHGPLTHHIQLRASILMDALNTNGIAIDTRRRAEKLASVQALMDDYREKLRHRGYLVDQPGSSKAMQSILKEFARTHPEIELKWTESGEKYSTAEEDLAELAAVDKFFSDYTRYRSAQKLAKTYLSKMDRPRLHAKFGYLLETGRTYCGGGFNLQNLPKEQDQSKAASTIRGAFVPGDDDRVFIDSDYGQIELVTFAYAREHQFGTRSELARRINAGEDIHRLIAATVLNKDIKSVTKAERDSAKPVSFGRPGGMGAATLRGIAKVNYGVDLTLDEVQQRIDAYHRLCPELDRHLEDEIDTGLVVAGALHLTPAQYRRATGQGFAASDPEADRPQGWLGRMLLKALRDPVPATQAGRSYSAEEIDLFWEEARRLPLRLKPKLQAQLAGRMAGQSLWEAVRKWAGRRPVFTYTGRLRANATFCSARNCIFQGLAADGAIYGLWLVWRAGHKLVSFIHDQGVVEAPADDRVKERAVEIEGLMRRGMLQVVPGMVVKVETVFTRSLNKGDLDRRYHPEVQEKSPGPGGDRKPIVPAQMAAMAG